MRNPIRSLVIAIPLFTAPLFAQDPATTVPVTFFGEIRARTEWDRPGGALAVDAYTYLRTRLGVRAAPADGVRLVFQLQDSRVYGVAASAAAATPDITDLHQAYVDLSSRWRDADVTTRVGRQEVAFGNERLVGPVGWSNTGRTFDGARLLFTPADVSAPNARPWNATIFVATVDERGRHFGVSPAPAGAPSIADHAVAGAWFTHTIASGSLEGTLLYDAAAKYRSYDGSNRYTLDARFRSRAAAPFDVDLEAAWQGGRQRYAPSSAVSVRQDVSAWLLGARLGALPAPGRKTTVLLGADVLSGDAKPADGEYRAFNTMYATNHPFYGIADLFLDPAARTNDAGLVDVFGSAGRDLNTRLSLRADLHRFAVQAGSAGEIGWELDLVAPVKLSRAASLELGYTGFKASVGATAIGLGASGDARHWAYVQLRASF